MKKIAAAAFLVTALCLIVLAQDAQQPTGGGGVVLRVNAKETTRAEFEKLLFECKAREFMEELVDWLLVQQAAEKAGVTVSGKEVTERQNELLLQELAHYNNDLKELEAELKRYGYTIEERKKNNAYKTRLLLLAEKLVKKKRASDENMKALFERRYPKDAGRIARVHHILVSTEEMAHGIAREISRLKCELRIASAEQKQKIDMEIAGLTEKSQRWKKLNSKDVADEVVKKLRAGENFAKIATEYGAGYTAESFDMGWVPKGALFNLLVPVVFDQLKPGEVAEPVQSRFGFHIVKLVDIKDVSQLKYEEVQPFLLDEEERRHVDGHEIGHLVQHLREEAKVERFDLSGGTEKSEK